MIESRRLGGRVVLAGMAAAVAIGGLIALQGYTDLWVLGLAMAVAPLLWLADRELLVYACMVAVYVLDWMALDLGLLPPQAAWLLEVALAVLLFRSLLIAYERRTLKLPLVVVVLGATIILSAVVATAVGVPAIVGIVGLRAYLRFPLLAVCLVIAPMSEGFEARLWRAILVTGALQVIVSVWQALTVGPGDLASGTFGLGGTGVQALFLSVLAATIIVKPVAAGRTLRPRDVVLGLVVFTPSVIGSAVAAYVVMPACVLFGLVAYGRRPGRVVLGLALAALAFLAIAPYALDYTRGIGYVDAETLLSSPDAVLEYDRNSTATGITMGRIDQVLLAGNYTVRRDPSFGLLGRGPASASRSSLGPAYNGPLYRLTGVQFVVTGLALGLLELGVAGVAAWVAVFVSAVRTSMRAVRLRLGVESPPHTVDIFAGIFGFAMLISGAYSNPWFLPGTALAFWLAFGSMLSRHTSVGITARQKASSSDADSAQPATT